MGLFKRFAEKKTASKAERESFKAKLRYGHDPKQMYDTSREHWDEYRRLTDETKALLQKILKVTESNTSYQWSSLEIQDRSTCKKSPVGKHVYMSVYGSKHPDYYEATNCICCNKQLYRATKRPEEE